MLSPDHYRVLGVRPDAGEAEIRRAYLRLAREHHPDLWAERGPADRARAEARMREVNGAWAVLGDVGRRRSYDLTRPVPPGAAARPTASQRPPVVQRPPSQHFRPYHEGPVAEDPRLAEDEAGVPGTGPGRLLATLPIVTFLFGLLVLFAGALLHSPGVLAGGIITMVLSGAAFVLAPMAVMFRSARAERQTRSRR